MNKNYRVRMAAKALWYSEKNKGSFHLLRYTHSYLGRIRYERQFKKIKGYCYKTDLLLGIFNGFIMPFSEIKPIRKNEGTFEKWRNERKIKA